MSGARPGGHRRRCEGHGPAGGEGTVRRRRPAGRGPAVRVPADLAALSAAWRDPRAWQGTTRIGGVELPAAVAGKIVPDELVVHGWDVARTIGRPYDCGAEEVNACMEFVSPLVEPGQEAARAGVFRPAVDVPADAAPLERLLAPTGRSPSWPAAV